MNRLAGLAMIHFKRLSDKRFLESSDSLLFTDNGLQSSSSGEGTRNG